MTLKTPIERLDDEWETPNKLYDFLCEKYSIIPKLDVAANYYNKKCERYIPDDKYGGALNNEIPEHQWTEDVWCNPPHSKTEAFVRKAYHQNTIYNVTIMMIIPANSMCTNYAEQCILNRAFFWPINRKYCKFLNNGKEKDHSRNGYFVVIWKKKQ